MTSSPTVSFTGRPPSEVSFTGQRSGWPDEQRGCRVDRPIGWANNPDDRLADGTNWPMAGPFGIRSRSRQGGCRTLSPAVA